MKATSLTITKRCRVAMLTFGGQQVWWAKKDERFLFDFVVEVNPAFVLVRSGLNHYVFERSKVRLHGFHLLKT